MKKIPLFTNRTKLDWGFKQMPLKSGVDDIDGINDIECSKIDLKWKENIEKNDQKEELIIEKKEKEEKTTDVKKEATEEDAPIFKFGKHLIFNKKVENKKGFWASLFGR